MKRLLAWTAVAFGAWLAAASPIAAVGSVAEDSLEARDSIRFSVGPYASMLARVVGDDGRVDYAALRDDHRALDAFAASISDLPRSAYETWTRDGKIAFWVNAYNAFTLELIVDHYPIRPSALRKLAYPANSIRQIPGAWDTVTFDVMGDPMTLDHIEHSILRKEFAEPRIHMALVCAAVSCPPLRSEPFRGESLDGQLDDQARRFLRHRAGFAIDRAAGVVWLSAIFDWFGEDFVEHYGGGSGQCSGDGQCAVLRFVGRYVDEADRDYLEARRYDVRYFDYDWTLNEIEK